MGKIERVGSQRRLSSTASFQRKYSKRMSRRMSLAVPAPDGGWGWVVCLASCWTNGTIFGVINSFGVLFVVMLDQLEGATSFKTAWVGSVCAGLTFMLSPFASVVTDQLGCRLAGVLGGALATAGLLCSSFVHRVEYMYLTYGLMTGVGFSIAYNPSLFILGLYFKRRLGLANGLVTFGSGIFTIGLPLGMKQILDAVGLANTLRVLAGIAFIMMLGALVFQPVMTTIEIIEQIETKFSAEVEKEKNEKLSGPKKRTLKQSLKRVFDTSIWKIRNYRIWVIGIPAGLFGYFVPFTHLVKHTNDILPGYNAELLITCIGATSGIGRLFFGYISDSPRIKNRVQLQQLSYLIMGVCTTLLPVAVHYGTLIAITLVMGIFDGCFVAMMGPVAFDLVGKEKASQGIGCVLGLMSFPMMIGPPMAGLIYDLVNSYIPAFFISGASPIIGACILCLIRKPKPTDDDDDVFLEQSTTLIPTGYSGSESSDDSLDIGTRRNGYANVDYETEVTKKRRPAFFLGPAPRT
ncbi:monocarboxylate transporter 10-like [Amphiura filiformis]|uniref:monocarboxylate transporter 10-like n=1 Tax=Amphiura filiformis TaxID=82378 RepID=UPI003B215E04